MGVGVGGGRGGAIPKKFSEFYVLFNVFYRLFTIFVLERSRGVIYDILFSILYAFWCFGVFYRNLSSFLRSFLNGDVRTYPLLRLPGFVTALLSVIRHVSAMPST